jgi:hypothetical protein
MEEPKCATAAKERLTTCPPFMAETTSNSPTPQRRIGKTLDRGLRRLQGFRPRGSTRRKGLHAGCATNNCARLTPWVRLRQVAQVGGAQIHFFVGLFGTPQRFEGDARPQKSAVVPPGGARQRRPCPPRQRNRRRCSVPATLRSPFGANGGGGVAPRSCGATSRLRWYLLPPVRGYATSRSHHRAGAVGSERSPWPISGSASNNVPAVTKPPVAPP